MTKFRSTVLAAGVALVLSAMTPAQAASVLIDYTGSVAADVSFGAHDGASTPGAEGLAIVVPAGGDTFGGTTASDAILLSTPVLTAADTVTVRAKLGPSNSTDFVVAIREASNEFFAYSVPASAFNETTFEDYTIDLSTFFFNGDPTDSMLNDSPIEVSFQTPFGGSGGLDVVVESFTTSAMIPEPASMAIAGMGMIGLLSVRRRRA